MEISKFKKGDVIQRVKPTARTGDHSYMGSRLEFLGVEGEVIFLRSLESIIDDGLKTLPAYDWDDDGWGLFPEKAFKKLEKEFGVAERVESPPQDDDDEVGVS